MLRWTNEEPPHSLEHFPELPIEPAILRRNFAMRALVGQVPIKVEPYASDLFNLVRLSEKAVARYNSARSHFAALVAAEISVTEMMATTDAMEDCINALHRGFGFAERLRRYQLPGPAKVELRKIRSLIERATAMRDAIEHRDTDLRADRPEGDAAHLRVGNMHVNVADRWMTYVEVCRLVVGLHSIACTISPPD